MPALTVNAQIDAPPDVVWSMLADFGDVGWIPMATRVDVRGQGVGMSRSIYGGGETPVVETLTSIEPEQMKLGYEITDNPLPVSRFEALVSVTPAQSPGSSTLTWEVDYDPAGDTPDDAKAARESVEAVYGMMAGWLGDAAAAAQSKQ
jgi:hypothetical protein